MADNTRRAGQAAVGPVALFIDWDNFAIGLRQEMPDRPADVGPILRWVRKFGPLVVCRAYGEWRDPAERLAIYNAGVEVVYAPVLPLGGSLMARDGGGAKSLADTAMAVDIAELLGMVPSLTTLIMATSDKDLIPVIRLAQRRGLNAVVVGSDRTAGALRDLADEFVSYRQLLDQESGNVSPASRPVTVPPMRYPRAPRAAVSPVSPSDRGPAALPAPRPHRGAQVAPAAPIEPPAAAAMRTSPGAEAAVPAEAEDAGDAAGRRRRRGGRRRRPGEAATPRPDMLATGAAAGAEEEEEEDVTTSEPAPRVPAGGAAQPIDAQPIPPAPAPTLADAGIGRSGMGEPNPVRPDARGLRATPGAIMADDASPSASDQRGTPTPTPSLADVGAAPTPSLADEGQAAAVATEPPVSTPRPSFGGPAPTPAERRAPVVLPGERLRKLATSPASAGAVAPGAGAGGARGADAGQPSRSGASEQTSGAAPTGEQGAAKASVPTPAPTSPAEQEAAAPGAIDAATLAESGSTDGDESAERGPRRSRRRGTRNRGTGASAEPDGGAVVGGGDNNSEASAPVSADTESSGGAADSGSDGADATEAGPGDPAEGGRSGGRRPRRRGGRGR